MKMVRTFDEFLKREKNSREDITAWKRWHWLENMVKEHGLKIGAEIGVKRGRNLFYLLEMCPDLMMIGVDSWEPMLGIPAPGGPYTHRSLDRAYDVVKRTAMERYSKRAILIRNWSHVAAPLIADKSLDFVFIDADHRYESVIEDIILWREKVKPGGFVTGHDLHFEGVAKAVTELYGDNFTEGPDHCWKVQKDEL